MLGGKLSFDAYNNGGEWLNSVHDVGASLVRVLQSCACLSFTFLKVGFVHAEDQYWEQGQHTGGGKAYKSVSLGRSVCTLASNQSFTALNSVSQNIVLQFAARTWGSVGQERVR